MYYENESLKPPSQQGVHSLDDCERLSALCGHSYTSEETRL
jgi:hypothetical protein